MNHNKRHPMHLALTTLAVGAVAVLAPRSAAAFEPQNVECIAPSGPGGGWDFTCRQVGKALYDQSLVPGPVQVSNMAGGSGGVAYAAVVSKRNEDNNLIVAASTATTTRLAQGAFVGMNQDMVRWLGTVGADYGVIAVAQDSPHQTLTDLMDAIKADPTSISIAGGSAVGGWDHLKALIAARSAGVENLAQVKYIAFQGGGEAVTQLLGGHVQAFSGDISEAQGFMDAGDIRVLAVLSEERLPGDLADLPTAKEQGIDAIGANWRGFYGPGEMSEDAYAYWTDAIQKVYESDAWKKTMAANGLMPLGLYGDELQEFVANQIADIEALSREIGIIN
ncbi:MAG TPA: tripartite tricarboxylate transporter substrate-binding protein [Geminicoccaceae bacterium]|nr:tripartite tricarboxylate transporter substrate-binding protein [Geminicoccaceae bacterium]